MIFSGMVIIIIDYLQFVVQKLKLYIGCQPNPKILNVKGMLED